ncbi:MAG TPA: hypothetical protein VF537_05210, partial [Rhizobium sp.]
MLLLFSPAILRFSEIKPPRRRKPSLISGRAAKNLSQSTCFDGYVVKQHGIFSAEIEPLFEEYNVNRGKKFYSSLLLSLLVATPA